MTFLSPIFFHFIAIGLCLNTIRFLITSQAKGKIYQTDGGDGMTEENIRKVFSKNLRMLREKKGLSQMELASKSCLATNFINDIENGKKWISPATLSKLSEALEIPPYKFFVEIEFDDKLCSGVLGQFCAELSNDIIDTIKSVSSRYS